MLTSTALDMDFVRAQFPGLKSDWAFFDNAGGSQIARQALARINAFLLETNVQIGGSYPRSVAAADALREAREAGRLLVNARRLEEIVFGASTTVHLQNLARAMRSQFQPGDEVVVSMSDHESNIGPWVALEDAGVKIRFWPINRETLTLDLAELGKLMNGRTRLVCVHHVSNILGVVNPIRDYADFVHARGARICVDAVAYAPHRAIDVQALDVDYYVFSLYKTYGPHYAVLYGRYEHLAELDTLYHYFYGKDKVPAKLEPGNAIYELAYSVCGIVDYLGQIGRSDINGDDADRDAIDRAFGMIVQQENALAERLCGYLTSRRDCTIIAPERNDPSGRIPTISFTLEGRDSGEVARTLEMDRIAVRFGDFHSRRLIEELGLVGSSGVIRASLVHYNTIEEVDRMIASMERHCPVG